MPKSKICLPDVNVWLALASSRHVHNVIASRWMDTLGRQEAVLCRLTQMGMLRLLTNPDVMKEDVFTQTQAWAIYERIRQDSRVHYVDEPPALELVWKQYSRGRQAATNLWTDTYLLAFASILECRLVTFDRALARLDSVQIELLK